MLEHYLILVSFLTTTALIWRALLLDHPRLLAFVEKIPVAGGALRCGFCAVLWMSLIGVIVYNPLSPLVSSLPFLIGVWVAWFVVSAAVLLARNMIAVLLEGAGVLTHLHRSAER